MQPQPPSKPRHGESRGAFKRRVAEEALGKSQRIDGAEEWPSTVEVGGWESSTPPDALEKLPDIKRHDPHRTDEPHQQQQHQHQQQQQRRRLADRLKFVRAVRPGVLREGIERNSPRVGSVSSGEVLEVLELQTSREGRQRVRTARGWLSERAASGRALLVPSSEQERAAREAAAQLPSPSQGGKAAGSGRRRRRRKRQGRRPPGGLVVIEDSAEARLLLRRQRRQTARADAPWRQPVPPLIRHEVVINSHPVRHLRQMSFGRGPGQFNTPRSLSSSARQDPSGFEDTSTRSLYGTERPPATPPKKFPFLRKTTRKIVIKYGLPYKKRIKDMQSTVMQDVRRSTLLHSKRIAEARAAAGEEVCEAFDNMMDGVVTEAEMERRRQMGELSQGLTSNAAAQAQLRQRGAEEIATRRAAGKDSENSDDEYMSDGGTVYAKGATAREARAKAIAEGKLTPSGSRRHKGDQRGYEGYGRSSSSSDTAGMSKHSRKEMAELLRDEGGMLADFERLKKLETVEIEQACKDTVEWMIRCLEAEQKAAAEEAARLAREAAEAAEREARARRDAELEARLAGLEEQVAAQKAAEAAQADIEDALRQKQIAEHIGRGDREMRSQRFNEAVRHYDSALEIDACHEEALRKRAAAAAAADGDFSLLSDADRAAAEAAARETAKKAKKAKRAKEEAARRAREEAAAARKRAAEERKAQREKDAADRSGRGSRSGRGKNRKDDAGQQGGGVVPRGMPGYKPLTLAELRERFDEVDKLGNGDGEIGPDEIEAAIEQHTLADWYHHLVDYDPGGSMLEHFQKFDTDGDGAVSFIEFCAGFGVDADCVPVARTPTPDGIPSAKDLHELFCYIDSDGDGSVDGQEVAVAIAEGSLLEWYAFMLDFMPGSSVFEYFDKNGDTSVEFHEFALAFGRRVPPGWSPGVD